LIVADTIKESLFPGAVEVLSRDGVRSFCILPLTTAHRRLGGMGFGSQRVDAYREADMEFLRYVAGQVAVAVDNALSHQDAQALQHQLERERDRLRLLDRGCLPQGSSPRTAGQRGSWAPVLRP